MDPSGLDPDSFRLEQAEKEIQAERERDALLIKAQSKLELGKKKEVDPRDA